MQSEHIVIQVAKKISEIYTKSVEHELNMLSGEIKEELQKVFLLFQEDFNLYFNDKKYYSFTYRVKGKDSLYEKLHRKNIIFDLIKELNITDITDINVDTLINKIKNFDDNIGFRIICDLQEDVENVFNLLKEKEKEFISLEFKNLDTQPSKMKNGHIIYKIEAKFKNTPFELQIKNKFDAAWGDMEHSLYYKNNKINIVKEINKISFNHVADMLKQIDNYMSMLRKMNKEALNDGIKEDNILILSKIEERYETPLKEAISNDFVFDFSNIAEQLIFMVKDKINTTAQVHIKRIIDEFLQNGKKRHNNWGIIILEAIYRDLVVDNENSFIEKYKEFIFEKLNISTDHIDLRKLMGLTYDQAIKEKPGSEHLIKLSNYQNLQKLGIQINDIILNEIEDEDEDDDIKEIIFKYFGFKYFSLSIQALNFTDHMELIDEINEKLKSSDLDHRIKTQLGLI